MHLQVHFVAVQQVADGIGHLDGARHFGEQALLDGHRVAGLVVVDEHEATASFSEEHDHRGKLGHLAVDLAVRADADLELVAELAFPHERAFHCFLEAAFDLLAVEAAPGHGDGALLTGGSGMPMGIGPLGGVGSWWGAGVWVLGRGAGHGYGGCGKTPANGGILSGAQALFPGFSLSYA